MEEALRGARQMLTVGFEGTSPTPELRRFLGERGGGGYILFRRNLEDPDQILDLNRTLRGWATGLPAFAMVDQEGGPVMRLRGWGSDVPAMAAVGRSGSARHARRMGELLGREIHAVGFNVDCAPVLDVHSNPDNPIIGDRALGTDPREVGRLGGEFIRGMHRSGILTCGKHFPGHGDTLLDSHLDLPRLDHDRARLDAVELVPFRRVFAENPPALVMTAHVLYRGVDPDLPGTLSPTVTKHLLREEMGFQGVVVTDDLEMKALADRYSIEEIVRLGLEAGVDVFLICKEEERWMRAEAELERLLVDGLISVDRIQRSVRRIARAKGPLRDALVPDAEAPSRVLRCSEHLAWLEELAQAELSA